MQKRVVIKNGKKYIVNTPGWEDEGVGPGFPVGQMVFKSFSDSFWYVVMASGSAGQVSASVSQSALSFPTSSYFDQNYPYQLLYSPNTTASYYVYLSGSAPSASLLVSQSAYTGSDTGKPSLILQNITDGNFYRLYVSSSTTGATLRVDQTMVSSSWITF